MTAGLEQALLFAGLKREKANIPIRVGYRQRAAVRSEIERGAAVKVGFGLFLANRGLGLEVPHEKKTVVEARGQIMCIRTKLKRVIIAPGCIKLGHRPAARHLHDTN